MTEHNEASLSATVHRSMTEIDPALWHNYFGEDDPFLRWDFLHGLESTECTTAQSGWQPAHIQLDRMGSPLGFVPAYVKGHSYGEYVFDWSWAEAWQRMGLEYYPKLVTAVPFTPATGQRLWHDNEHQNALSDVVYGVRALCSSFEVSSWHVLFLEQAQSDALVELGMPQRLTTQFHWFNRGYRDFQDFLARFNSRKRKNLRRERDQIARQGLVLETKKGDEITPDNWRFFHRCYQTTYAKRSGHGGYLTETFFTEACPALGATPVMVLASCAGEAVAAALFFEGGDTLYGRYWGCLADFDYLHFEACYYRGIEYCIDAGLSRFDPGAQGEHKIQRGFEPVLTYSNHWIVDERFSDAVAQFAAQECDHVRAYQTEAATLLPFKLDGL